MKFEALLGELKKVEITEMRFDLCDYIEFVVQAATLDKVKRILESYFGRAVDFKDAASSEPLSIAEKWGGIRGNQILYFHSGEQEKNFAMIWPWCDGRKVSIKIVKHPSAYGMIRKAADPADH